MNRLEKMGQVISASKVRKYNGRGTLGRNKKIAPKTTYDYIQKNKET